LLLLICILVFLLFWFLAGVRIHRANRRSTLKNRRDVGLGEQDPSANPPVLDAILANDSPERFAANLKHRRCLFGRKNFHRKLLQSGDNHG
jgi:hypothetical protein